MPSLRTPRGCFAMLAAFAASHSATASQAYITSRTTNVVEIVDTTSNTIVATLPTGAQPVGVGARPDGREVWIANAGSNDITVIRPWTRTVVATFSVCAQPFSVAFLPDSTRAYVSCKGANAVAVVDVATRAVVATLPTPQQPTYLAIDRSGTRLVVGSEGIDGSYRVFDTATNAAIVSHAATFPSRGIAIDDTHSLMYVASPTWVYMALTGTWSASGGVPLAAITAIANEYNTRTWFVTRTPVAAPVLEIRDSYLGTFVGSAPIGGDPVSVDYAPDTRRLYVVDGTSGLLRVFDRDSLAPVATLQMSARPASFGRFIVTPSPPVPPRPPTGVSAVAGYAQATVSFTPSGDDGDGTVSGFRAACGSRFVDGPASPIVVAGLTNNQTVTCTVATINESGPGTPSSPSNAITPDSPLEAPVIARVARGDHSLIVHFLPGPENFASPPFDYTATCGTHSRTGAASPLTIDGLALGVPLTCTVRVRNVVGDSAPSAPSASVAPATYPGAPSIATATSRDEAAQIAFDTPASDGGAPIESYVARCGDASQSAVASPIVVGGLTNNQTYTCTVAATNEVGTGAASAPSNAVTPDGPPTAPFLTFVDRGDGTVIVYFAAGPDNHASPATRYTATCGTGTAAGPSSPLTVGGLPIGEPVTCTVIATNVIGDSPPSSASVPIAPATVPGAPTLESAAAGDASIALAFATPASDGGAAISGYRATCGMRTQPATESPVVVTGLVNGQTYTCSVVARNEIGTGETSNALSATPRVTADVSIALSNGADYVQAGVPIEYLIDVVNHGAVTVTGARVTDTLDAEFGAATWACSGTGGAACPTPAAGTGNVDALVTLPPGAGVSFLLTTSVAPLPELPVGNTATVAVPNDVADPSPANNAATDGPDARVLFRDDFE